MKICADHDAGFGNLYAEGWVEDQRISGASLVDPSTISAANWPTTGIVTLPELVTSDAAGVGRYAEDSPYTGAGIQHWKIYTAAPAIGDRPVTLVDLNVAAVGDAMTLAASEQVYHALIDLTRDAANTRDEYTVGFQRDLVLLTSGVTSPTIQVIKRADGADLVAQTALTQIGSTGMYTYNASGAERLTLGESAIVVVRATVDAAVRTIYKVVARDA